MAHIDYYFTPLSPFAYLAGDGLEKIAEKYGATIAYKPVNAGRLMSETGGLPVPQRHPSRQAYRLQDLPRIAKRAGLAINLQPAHWPTDQSRAISAVLAAKGGDTGRLAQVLARACWAEDKDIADQAVIDAALIEAGFDTDCCRLRSGRRADRTCDGRSPGCRCLWLSLLHRRR